MAGRPLTRAKREALVNGDGDQDAALQSGRWDEPDAESDGQLAEKPLCSRGRAPVPVPARAQPKSLAELLPELLMGSALGTSALVELIKQGAISPRDLAVTTSILIDKAHKLRDLAPEPTTGAADLEREADEIQRLAAELKRRGE